MKVATLGPELRVRLNAVTQTAGVDVTAMLAVVALGVARVDGVMEPAATRIRRDHNAWVTPVANDTDRDSDAALLPDGGRVTVCLEWQEGKVGFVLPA